MNQLDFEMLNFIAKDVNFEWWQLKEKAIIF